ncbi:response regulator [Methylobacterium sp. WSM2598]|uniref:response regulator n=1 Tax=Methylobacterium sp. WSM2598 TaxID=398261 RepID=UPI0003A93544|nr:response regulator [Methylobacterium sp. WSM2598]
MAHPSPSLIGRRVLVVEDEYLIAMDMAHSLQQAGAEVVGPVPDVEQALALIEAAPLDAAVLDVNLRNEAVYVVADRLRERGAPYLFATGEVQIADRSDYRSRPKLEKPILGTELVRAVGKLLPG